MHDPNILNWTHCSISRLNSVYDTQPREYLLSTIFKEMQQGAATLTDVAEEAPYRTLAEVTERARELRYKRGNIEAYNLLKKGMPQFIPAAVLTTRSDVQSFSTLACLEWDGDVDVAHALVIGKQHPNVLAIWRSLSRNPKVLVPITPVSKEGAPLTTKNFRHAWHTVSCLFEEIGDADTAAMSPIQPQALCYDPDLYVNWKASPVEWDIDDYAFEEAFPNLITPENLAYAELPVAYHIAIQEMMWRSDGWGRTRVPCPWEDHENDGWDSRGNATRIRKHGENDFTFQCFKCNDTPIKRYSETPLTQQSNPMTVSEMIEKAPLPIEIRTPSFRNWTEEERIVVNEIIGVSPDAGWHEGIPAFATRYKNLHRITGEFSLNGQPSEIEKRRVWSTQFGRCEKCGDVTADWVDRYHLTVGRYCNSCHTDTPLGSYLEWELQRKLPNSIVSEYQGFLGDNAEFQDFRLWQPGMLTHLGAAMYTGKTTTIVSKFREFAAHGLGRGLIVVPRVSLARFLVHQLRQRDGYPAWGGWYEGAPRSDRFIGEIGAIVCLPSLPRAVETAEASAGNPSLYIAIDEVDFNYNLLTLAVENSTKIKKILREALNTTGLVVAGQSEFTLSLEALTEELETSQVQGFYASPEPSDGIITLHKYPNEPGKENAVLAGSIADITATLDAGKNAYVFCASRRAGDIIAELFRDENPVVYNAYTKGDRRANAALFNQRLTDSRLFIGTNAVDVGISIYDSNAKTICIGGLIYGSRQAASATQTSVRVRNRNDVSHHYTDYNFATPLHPTETEKVSIYHEALKTALDTDADIPTASVKKTARAQALLTLADTQYEPFASHHLGDVAKMQVSLASALPVEPAAIARVSVCRQFLRETERAEKIQRATAILENYQKQLLTASVRRKRTAAGRIRPEESLAQEYANRCAQAIGWTDAPETLGELDAEDIQVARALAEKNIDILSLEKQRRGYISRHFPKWTAALLKEQLTQTHHQKIRSGAGKEITAVEDDRLRGEILEALITRLQGQLFDTAGLSSAVREILKAKRDGKTFIGEIRRGALGASEYRKGRFLGSAEDTQIVNWVRRFLGEWYPVRIAKKGDTYRLVEAGDLQLRLKAFRCWLKHQISVDPPENMPPPMGTPPAPDPIDARKQIAIVEKQAGKTQTEIAQNVGVCKSTVSRWLKVTPLHKNSMNPNIQLGTHSTENATDVTWHVTLHIKLLEVLKEGEKQTKELIKTFNSVSQRHVKRELKRLVDAGEIVRVKRGVYRAVEAEGVNVTSKVTSKVTSLHKNPIRYKTQLEMNATNVTWHVTLPRQILLALKRGEKRTQELISACPRNSPTSVKNELKRLVDTREIVRVRHGVYSVSADANATTAALDAKQPEAANVPLKTLAQERRASGESIQQIADDLGRHRGTVSRWCREVNPLSGVETEILNLLADGVLWKLSDVVKRSGFARQNITIAMKRLVNLSKVHKAQRGFYQRT